MAKKIAQQSANFTRKHALNAGTAISLQDCDGKRIEGIYAAAVLEDVDRETGEQKLVGVLVDKDSKVYSTISTVILDQMEDIIGLIEDGEDFDIEINARKTRNGSREFLTATIL